MAWQWRSAARQRNRRRLVQRSSCIERCWVLSMGSLVRRARDLTHRTMRGHPIQGWRRTLVRERLVGLPGMAGYGEPVGRTGERRRQGRRCAARRALWPNPVLRLHPCSSSRRRATSSIPRPLGCRASRAVAIARCHAVEGERAEQSAVVVSSGCVRGLLVGARNGILSSCSRKDVGVPRLRAEACSPRPGRACAASNSVSQPGASGGASRFGQAWTAQALTRWLARLSAESNGRISRVAGRSKWREPACRAPGARRRRGIRGRTRRARRLDERQAAHELRDARCRPQLSGAHGADRWHTAWRSGGGTPAYSSSRCREPGCSTQLVRTSMPSTM